MLFTGKTTIFVREIKKEGNIYKFFATSISNKQEDGTYINLNVDCFFTGENFPKEKVNMLDAKKCYLMDVKAGYPSVRNAVDKEGNAYKKLVLVITEAYIISSKEVKTASTGNPW